MTKIVNWGYTVVFHIQLVGCFQSLSLGISFWDSGRLFVPDAVRFEL